MIIQAVEFWWTTRAMKSINSWHTTIFQLTFVELSLLHFFINFSLECRFLNLKLIKDDHSVLKVAKLVSSITIGNLLDKSGKVFLVLLFLEIPTQLYRKLKTAALNCPINVWMDAVILLDNFLNEHTRLKAKEDISNFLFVDCRSHKFL